MGNRKSDCSVTPVPLHVQVSAFDVLQANTPTPLVGIVTELNEQLALLPVALSVSLAEPVPPPRLTL